MSPEERVARAIRVKALLDDPDIKAALATIEAEMTEEWKKTHDAAERDNLWRAVNVMHRLEAWMRSAASHDLSALKRAK